MTIKASARSAMLFAAGLLVSLAGSAPAIAAGADDATVSKSESAASGQSDRQGSRHLKKRHTDRKSTRAAAKSDESKKAEEKQVADASSAAPRAIPEWLANANAQMTTADAPPDSANGMSAAMSEKANTVLQAAADKPADAQESAEAGVVPSDQLNDVDRALQETPVASETAATQTLVLASTSRAGSETVAQASNDSSTLDKTSLIGKIFIAFGALLTVASAARMFMA
ncbi:hypothetical protein J6524_22645 [Bradyrhizobium sp. WSM 1738]|uniref:hypothetical protein n=1 Tax=Bradyrhizobium hereditatis TaxID=2821405 RepID=UPI001CE2B348|nr:hypothetical protein [Bradyrhizobium hereditatis]MCA6117648.1 hypothetical protein [Bradyrhizobium hereditatis]